MTKFTEGRHPTEGLMSEANGHRSRDNITIAAGSGIIEPGTVLGKITASGKYTASPNAVVAPIAGAETATAIALYRADATGGDVKISAITRDAEWNVNTLTYDASVNDDAKKATKRAQLAAVGIIAR